MQELTTVRGFFHFSFAKWTLKYHFFDHCVNFDQTLKYIIPIVVPKCMKMLKMHKICTSLATVVKGPEL